MNRFKRHVPAFVSGELCEWEEFGSLDELIGFDCVSKFAEMDRFDYFAISENRLLALFDSGDRYYTVGFIEDPSDVELLALK